jgi:hypothetical protein
MTLRNRIEERIQREIIAYLAAVTPRALVFACPNAAPRTYGGRASNGVPGLTKGAPDLIAVFPGGRVVFIECKTPKGQSSMDQIAFSGRCNALGQSYFVARSHDDVRHALAVLNIDTMEHKKSGGVNVL